MMRKEITYFENKGPENTMETFRLAKARAEELGIKDVIVASTSGETGVKATEIFEGYNIVVVSHHTGYKEPGFQEMTEENLSKIREKGGKVLTCIHAFLGLERAIRSLLNTAYPVEVIAQTLRLFGQGTKVAIEISLMAADAGLIPVDRDVITIGGSGKGADTALVIKPANSIRFFDLFVREIIVKPRAK